MLEEEKLDELDIALLRQMEREALLLSLIHISEPTRH